MGNPVIPMLGMTPEIAVEPIAHVHQLFDDDNLQRLRPRPIDPRQIDEDIVLALPLRKGIRSTQG